MSILYDVSSKRIKISYKEESEFNDWNFLRTTNVGVTLNLSNIDSFMNIQDYTILVGNTWQEFDKVFLVG